MTAHASPFFFIQKKKKKKATNYLCGPNFYVLLRGTKNFSTNPYVYLKKKKMKNFKDDMWSTLTFLITVKFQV